VNDGPLEFVLIAAGGYLERTAASSF
jgi:hypothetical protein